MQRQDISSVIERVKRMEQYFDEVSKALECKANDSYENAVMEKMVQELNEYMDSGLWLQDYECDERGELPNDLKCGVLSEDGLYNLLVTIHTSV